MTRRPAFDGGLAAVAGTVCVLAGLMFFALLMMLEEPPAIARGVARENRRMDTVEGWLRRPREPYADPPNAICEGDVAAAAGDMRRVLEAAAAGGKLALTGVAVAPGAPDASTIGLYPVAVQFEASGSYEAVVGLLKALSRSRPEVFLNTVDLKTRTIDVDLKVNGRFFCSTSALP